MKTRLALFEESDIRKVYKNNTWYYSILDVINKLTETENPNQYLKSLKQKDQELEKNWDSIVILINMQTKDGKIRKAQASNTVGILRIIESISSKKAESFKQWLAKLGYERLEEITNPELAMNRMKQIYEMKGYSNTWIEQREREITTRHSLKDEWKNRGIENNTEYNLLTKEIYEETFGINIELYKKSKKIDNDCLKDNMTNLELALLNLNENVILEMHKKNKSIGYEELQRDIAYSSKIITKTKKEIETILNKKVVSPENKYNLTSNTD